MKKLLLLFCSLFSSLSSGMESNPNNSELLKIKELFAQRIQWIDEKTDNIQIYTPIENKTSSPHLWIVKVSKSKMSEFNNFFNSSLGEKDRISLDLIAQTIKSGKVCKNSECYNQSEQWPEPIKTVAQIYLKKEARTSMILKKIFLSPS